MFSIFTKTLRRKKMDILVNTGKNIETRIMECPGQWMSEAELSQLSNDLIQIAAHTLPKGGLTYGVFSGTPEHLKNSVITLVRRKRDKKPIAFNALAIMDMELGGKPVRVLHLGLVMIDPNEQSRGQIGRAHV